MLKVTIKQTEDRRHRRHCPGRFGRGPAKHASRRTHLLFLTVTMPNAALMFGTLIGGFAIGVLAAGHIASVASDGLRSEHPPNAVFVLHEGHHRARAIAR